MRKSAEWLAESVVGNMKFLVKVGECDETDPNTELYQHRQPYAGLFFQLNDKCFQVVAATSRDL